MLWNKNKPPVAALPDITLQHKRIILRPPGRSDWKAWCDIRTRNAAYLKPFEPRWPENCLSEDFFARRLLRQIYDWESNNGQSFLIMRAENAAADACLIGGMNINNICRGAAHYASLGYWIDEAHQGQGYMHEALEKTLQYAFEDLGLHRVHASCMPRNTRSKNLLLKAGFAEEGFAEKYLQINGEWEDHCLFGYTYERWSAS